MKKIWHDRSAWRLAAAVVIGSAILTACSDCYIVPMDGIWAGVVSDTYTSSGGSHTIEIEIDGSTITVTGGTIFATGTTGTLTRQSDDAYTVALDLAEAGEGQLYVDPQMCYALLFVHASDATYDFLIGILQRVGLMSFTCTEDDLAGDWEGTEMRVDLDLAVTSTSTSAASMYAATGVMLSGTDGDGAFSGVVFLETADRGFYISGPVEWPEFTRYALCTLSFDKEALALGFLTSASEGSLGDVLPDQKFALWLKQ